MKLYPLRFEPIFQTYLWGGRRLGEQLNKPIGDGLTYAESWEVVDHGESQSIVKTGELAGRSLRQLVSENGPELLGETSYRLIHDAARPTNLVGRFPLLFKFLDAKKNLSVQVHPNDQMGAELDPPDLGKTEAWVVIDALPGSKIYAGLKQGVTSDDFKKAIENNAAESMLHSFEPEKGDCVFIPAGTVHALGKGLLIAEIQQCSNTTFRLYDWGRVDADGRPRELHVEQGIEAIDFNIGPVKAQVPQVVDQNTNSLVSCDKFQLNQIQVQGDHQYETGGSFKILVVLDGSISLMNEPSSSPLVRGDCCLVPACLDAFEIKAKAIAELLWISPD